jgi:hypothetical protein
MMMDDEYDNYDDGVSSGGEYRCGDVWIIVVVMIEVMVMVVM